MAEQRKFEIEVEQPLNTITWDDGSKAFPEVVDYVRGQPTITGSLLMTKAEIGRRLGGRKQKFRLETLLNFMSGWVVPTMVQSCGEDINKVSFVALSKIVFDQDAYDVAMNSE